MFFIESPGFIDRDKMKIQFIKDVIQGLNGPGQDRTISLIKDETILLEQFPTLFGFGNSF
jgi:hypothetical protein